MCLVVPVTGSAVNTTSFFVSFTTAVSLPIPGPRTSLGFRLPPWEYTALTIESGGIFPIRKGPETLALRINDSLRTVVGLSHC